MKEITEQKKKAAKKQKDNAPKVEEEEDADIFHVFDGVESDDEMDLLYFPAEDDPFKDFDFTVPSVQSTDHQESDTNLDTLVDDFISQVEPSEDHMEEHAEEHMENMEDHMENTEDHAEVHAEEPSTVSDEESQQIDPSSAQSSESSPLPDTASPLPSNEIDDGLSPTLPSEEIAERPPEDNENPVVEYLDELYNYAVSQTIHF